MRSGQIRVIEIFANRLGGLTVIPRHMYLRIYTAERHISVSGNSSVCTTFLWSSLVPCLIIVNAISRSDEQTDATELEHSYSYIPSSLSNITLFFRVYQFNLIFRAICIAVISPPWPISLTIMHCRKWQRSAQRLANRAGTHYIRESDPEKMRCSQGQESSVYLIPRTLTYTSPSPLCAI